MGYCDGAGWCREYDMFSGAGSALNYIGPFSWHAGPILTKVFKLLEIVAISPILLAAWQWDTYTCPLLFVSYLLRRSTIRLVTLLFNKL